MNLLREIQYDQYWNIGFCEQTSEELVRDKVLKPIIWLKHPYRDRWFADPFILKVSDSEIVVLVEECPMDAPKGIISELVIDRKTITLKNRYVLLEKDTHLSYPAIVRHRGKVYVYPENGASGKLNIYEYHEQNHRLVNPVCILNEAVADATIVEREGVFFLTATKFPNTQKQAYLYHSASLFGPYKQAGSEAIQRRLSCARDGGSFFEAYGSLFRPAQNCTHRYGGALSIMSVNGLDDYQETLALDIAPNGGRYGLGLHTINFAEGVCVIDGCGYYKPILGRFYYWMRSLLSKK